MISVPTTASASPRSCCRRVFDLFVQGERTLDRSQGGLGIGLSLVQRLVEMHGGTRRRDERRRGRGATFEVRLPSTNAAQAAAKLGACGLARAA